MPQIGPLITGSAPALGLSTLLPLGEQDPDNLEEQLIAHSVFKLARHGSAITAVTTLLGVLAVPAMSASFPRQAPFVICSWVWGLSALLVLFYWWLRSARAPPAILEDHQCAPGHVCPAPACSLASALPVLVTQPQDSSPTSESELLQRRGLQGCASPQAATTHSKVTICDHVEEQTIPRINKFAELAMSQAEEASRKRALLGMFREDSAVSTVAHETTSPRCEVSQHSRLLSSPQRSQSFPMYSRESSRDMDGGYYQSRTNSRHLREDSTLGHSKPVRSGADPLRELEGLGSMRQTNGAVIVPLPMGLDEEGFKENGGSTAIGSADGPAACANSASSSSAAQQKMHQDVDLPTVWDEFDEEDPKIGEVTIPSHPKMLLAREPSDIIRQSQSRTCQGYYEPPRRVLEGADDAEEETPFVVSRPKHSVLSFVGAYAVLGFFFVVFCGVAGFEIAALLRPLPDRMPLTTVDSRHSPPHWPKTSLDMNESTVSKPYWVAGPWGHCTTGCGVGKMHREVRCAFGSHEDCIDQYGPPPVYVRPCREYMGCQWNAGPWGHCNATCGFGVQRREVLCTNSQIADCFVPRELWLVPNDTRECVRTDDCLWKIGDWSECSTTCGVGERRREATCTNGDERFCKVHGSQPDTIEACETYDKCRWNASAWSPCTSRCGHGTRTRTVECPSGNDTACLDQDGPVPHVEEACHDLTGCRWSITPWSKCTGRCGLGTQERNVSCGTGKEEDCAAHEPRPSQLRSCSDSEACEWTSSWSACSSACGTGQRSRNASCSPVSNPRPSDCGQESGGLKSVLFTDFCRNVSGCRWATGDWSNCSASCGRGTQHRRVFCSLGSDKDCAEHEAAPSSSQNCTGTHHCPRSNDKSSSEEDNCWAFGVAGVLHACAGWMLTFVGLQELAHQGAGREYSSNWGTLLAPHMTLVTGLGGLAGVLVFSRALLPGSEQVQKAALAGGHFATGLLCLGLGAGSLQQLSAYTGFREMFACAKRWQVRWLTSGVLLLIFCVGVSAVAIKQVIS